MNCNWVGLVSEAATEVFLRTGGVPVFRLKRGDLLDLAAQVMNRTPESIREDVTEAEGFLGLRCEVHCEQLGRAVRVDEWWAP
jgi:hypothetical protein